MNGGYDLSNPMLQRPGALGINQRMGNYTMPQWSDPNWKPNPVQMPTQQPYTPYQPPIGLPPSAGNWNYTPGVGFSPVAQPQTTNPMDAYYAAGNFGDPSAG